MTDITLTIARAHVIDAAKALLHATYPSDDYLRAVAPAEVAAGDTKRANEIGHESGCGLIRAAVEDAAFGMRRGLYRDGRAFEDVYERAGGTPWHPGGACVAATLETPPDFGDGLVWEHAGAYPDHIDAAVVDVVGGGTSYTLTVIAGGERVTAKDIEDGDAPDGTLGNETVKMLERSIRWEGHAWVDTVTRREVIAALNPDLYPKA